MIRKLKQLGALCRKHIVSSLILSTAFGWFMNWGLSWVVPSPSVEVNNFPQKELTCTLNSGFPLFQWVAEDDDFEIFYKGEVVKEPWIFNITIKNTGDQPILNQDFVKPLTIDFQKADEIIKASIIESSNEDLWNEFLKNTSIQDTSLNIHDLFLNPGEECTINVITEGKPSNIRYSQRTVGMTHLTIKNSPQEKQERLYTMGHIVVGVTVLSLLFIVAFLIYMKIKFKKDSLKLQELLIKEANELEHLALEETENEPEYQRK